MNRNFSLTLLFFVLALSGTVRADDATYEPREGVLLLRNQHVLAGRVTMLGDYVQVTVGGAADVKVPRKDVWLIGTSLLDLYEQRFRLVERSGIEGHIALADWCIRQKMPAQAAEQLVKAIQIDPHDRRVLALEQKLISASKPESTSKVQAAALAATVSTEQLERTVHELPAGALERFAVVVQPIVMDRCGASGCHGSGSTTNFQIVQPSGSRVPSRRYTQRNLFAVLSFVDRDEPEASQLLRLAREPHGGFRDAPLGEGRERQYEALRDWVLVAARPAAPTDRAAVSVANRSNATTQRQMQGPAPADDSRSPSDLPAALPTTVEQRDPFDPALFNERFFGKAENTTR
jgi:hypothetical protein